MIVFMMLLSLVSAQTRLGVNQINHPIGGVKELVWSEFIAAQQPDGTYLFPAAPIFDAVSTSSPATIFRNGTRQTWGTDITQDPANPLHFTPVTGAPWPATDSVVVDYWTAVNGGPTLGAPTLGLLLPTGSSLQGLQLTVPPPGSVPAGGPFPTLRRLGAFLRKEYPAPVLSGLDVVQQKCVRCHGIGAPAGNLDLRGRDSIFKGGTHGPAVVNFHPEQSLIWLAVNGQAPGISWMPPAGRLSPDETIAIWEWIYNGTITSPMNGPFSPKVKR